MKKSKLFPALIAVLVIAILLLNGIMIRENGINTETVQIQAIMDNSSDNRWVQFIAGMQQAAEDQNVKLTVIPTGHFGTLEEEKGVVDRAVRDGANGLVLQLCGDTNVHEFLQTLSGQIQVELVDAGTDETLENITGIVSPDHRAIGEALAEEALHMAPGDPEQCTFGIVSANSSLGSVKQTVQGFETAMAREGIEIAWTLEQKDGGDSLREMLEKASRPDVLVAMDNASLEAVGEYAASLEGATVVIGTGTSTKAIYYLDSGAVQSIVVPEDYMMGYRSVSDLADYIKKNTFTPRIRKVEHRVIHQDTIFEEENQGILFPIQR